MFMGRRIGLALLILLHLLIVVSIVRQPLDVNRQSPTARSFIWPLHYDTMYRSGPGADFFAVYHAGVAAQRGASPYARREDPWVTPYFFPFRYLPIVGEALGRLVTLGPPRTAYGGWIALVEILTAVLAWMLVRRLRSPIARWGTLILLLLSSPYFLELHMGQFTYAATALLAFALLSLEAPLASVRRGRTTLLAAASYTAAVLLKIFPLASAPALLRPRRGRMILAVALGIVLVTTLPYFLAHPADWRTFAAANLGAPADGLDVGNFGLVYLLYVGAVAIGGDGLRDGWPVFLPIWRLAVLGVTALLVLVARRPSVLVGAVVMVLAHFLSYAHVWEHHMSAVLILGLLLVLELERRPGPRLELPLTGAALLLLALPSPFGLLNPAPPGTSAEAAAAWPLGLRALLPLSKVLPTVLLYAVGVSRLGRRTGGALTA